MKLDFSEEASTDAVIESFSHTADPRLREIMASLIRHLHGFVREVGLTEAEWARAIGFLTATGQMCDDKRQEFILLSDILGVSTLVDAITHRKSPGATLSTVLGPFHMVESPARNLGDSIAEVPGGDPCVVRGRVTSLDGRPLAGASVDVWQANERGFYDVQTPDETPIGHLRGLFTTDANGEFRFRTVTPCHYPVPVDGPVGDLLRAATRPNFRPAHIHFIASAPGHVPLTTHVFMAGSPHLDSDVVFGVKPSLVREFERVDDAAEARALGVTAPFRATRFDIVLEPA